MSNDNGEIEINDTAPILDEETEEQFRKLITDYCDVLVSPDVDKFEEYGRGMIWGAVTILDVLGYGDWARSVVAQEIEDYGRKVKGRGGFFSYLESKGFDRRTTRLLLPGNRFESGVNG